VRETAVFGYVIAICVAVATVVFGFTSVFEGHVDQAFYGTGIGAAGVILLWTMSNWIAKENV
jgi:hypothetical protein